MLNNTYKCPFTKKKKKENKLDFIALSWLTVKKKRLFGATEICLIQFL